MKFIKVIKKLQVEKNVEKINLGNNNIGDEGAKSRTFVELCQYRISYFKIQPIREENI